MAVALLGPLRDIMQASARDVVGRARFLLVKVALTVVAGGFLLSAALSALAHAVGYPLAALVFGVFFAVMALTVHLMDKRAADRQARQLSQATRKAKADLVVATALARSALTLLPIVGLVAAFVVGRRR
jgi:Na+/melibiose symporter-like transporter